MHPYQEEIWHKFQEVCMDEQVASEQTQTQKGTL